MKRMACKHTIKIWCLLIHHVSVFQTLLKMLKCGVHVLPYSFVALYICSGVLPGTVSERTLVFVIFLKSWQGSSSWAVCILAIIVLLTCSHWLLIFLLGVPFSPWHYTWLYTNHLTFYNFFFKRKRMEIIFRVPTALNFHN